jgi:hypothetical protein
MDRTVAPVAPDQAEAARQRPVTRYVLLSLGLAAALLAPVLATLEWVGWRLGATVPLATIAERQQHAPEAVWLGAFRDYAAYKLERIRLVQPEVLLVGSSRCGQARAQVFRPYRTYNACLTAWPLAHVADFVARATDIARPRVVVLALDYFLFGDALADAWRKERTMDFRQGIGSHRRKLRDTLDFAIHARWNLDAIKAAVTEPQSEPVDGNRLIGTEAIRVRFGFRSDGSVMVAAPYRATSAEQLARSAQYVTSSFPGAAHLSEVQFGELARLADLARRRGFSLVAIQYPFVQSATAYLDTSPDYWPQAGLWRELRSETTARRLADLGIRFFDMSRTDISADAANFFDPAHPSERGIVKTVIALSGRKEFSDLLPKIDGEALRRDLDLPTDNPFDLYR